MRATPTDGPDVTLPEVMQAVTVPQSLALDLLARVTALEAAAPAGYVHVQAAPAATWTINHNLGFQPAVELIDVAGNAFNAWVHHVSANTAMVHLTAPAAGMARLN